MIVADENATGAPETTLVLTISMNFPPHRADVAVKYRRAVAHAPPRPGRRARARAGEGFAVTVGMEAKVSVPVGVSVAHVVVLLDALSESLVCVVIAVSVLPVASRRTGE